MLWLSRRAFRALALLALAFTGGLACPLAHDGYETDRPCWDDTDCVAKERCERGDAGTATPGRCGVPSDGPCGPLDGGGGYYCFPNEAGVPEICFHDLQDRCIHCGLDGSVPDAGCPTDDCLEWKDRWRCL